MLVQIFNCQCTYVPYTMKKANIFVCFICFAFVTQIVFKYGTSLAMCTTATFYSVSISKPIPVWFGKKFKILTTRFPNQFQFGLEKNYNFDDSFSKPIPVWFGKNDHISEAKNSKLIIIWTKESWFPASVTGSSFLKLC